MIPATIDRLLSGIPGSVGSAYQGYKSYRWGDPHVRILSKLCDRNRISVDVGAHLGEYTYFLQRFSAGCVAFECLPNLAAHLRRRFGNSVDIRSEAVSNVAGIAELRVPKAVSHTDFVRATIESANKLSGDFVETTALTVKTVRLDDAVEGEIGFIKVDVEGHELAVLEGASRILARDKPNLILELEDRHAPGIVRKAFGLLEGQGYHGAYLLSGKIVRCRSGEEIPSGVWNFIFQHAGSHSPGLSAI